MDRLLLRNMLKWIIETETAATTAPRTSGGRPKRKIVRTVVDRGFSDIFFPCSSPKMVKVLDLFSGSGSVTKAARARDWESLSVDISDTYMAPDIKISILDWDYKKVLQPGDVDIIFAGVPCTAYSTIQRLNYTREQRDVLIAEANKLALKTLEIIDYLKPKFFFIENPAGGELKLQSFMQNIPNYVVSYCKYGFAYQKHTRIWTNLTDFEAKKCNFDCEQLVPGRRQHIASLTDIGRTAPGVNPERQWNAAPHLSRSSSQRYSYPPALVNALFDATKLS